ncbi:MAG: DUF3160 domain-containing protein [Ignavibacteriaceae bacterium]
MKKLLFTLLVLFSANLSAQTFQLNLDAYKSFLVANKNITYSQLSELHNAGKFAANIYNNWNDALYINSIESNFGLTNDEKDLLQKNGFVVTERLSNSSMARAYIDIYNRDLPVFITSDAILHAFHCSYDEILKQTELRYLIDEVKNLLQNLHSSIPAFANRYQVSGDFDKAIRDVDVYLTVPLRFFDPTVQPNYVENQPIVDSLYDFAMSEKLANVKLFSSVSREIDFSQFKPRGHYVDQQYPQLASYFRAMMWFGRIELYLIAPNDFTPRPFEDVQRQAIISYLLSELIDYNNAKQDYEDIEAVIKSFVGEQDNVTLDNLYDLKTKAGFSSAMDLADSLTFVSLQDTLSSQPYADQKILSQVLIKNPDNPDQLKPASSFMLFGQRFVIDSFITGDVVYDKVPTKRMLPSTLDIMFSLGNDAALQLLKDEIEKYKYESNLASLRYIVDSYTNEFWESSIYNNWLNSIRSLNPPVSRDQLPKFMQTAAWWQEKLNTQLSSWTELRHDNLLYAKQSYTGGATCSYPYSYVEPVPAFYSSMKNLANSFTSKLQNLALASNNYFAGIENRFNYFAAICDTLANIAQKELDNSELTESENSFLKRMLSTVEICGTQYSGWFPRIYSFETELQNNPMVVADYHTSPTDELGGMVGWVAHAGTGPVNMAIITVAMPSGENVAFIGPVMSYYEYTSTNFLRLTDEEWQNFYYHQSLRPDWTNAYIADHYGNKVAGGSSLVTAIENNGSVSGQPITYLTAQNYPNPFNPSSIIVYNIPKDLAFSNVRLTVYDIQGKEIKTLLNDELPAGKFMTKWDGKNSFGQQVASGVYLYSLRVGDRQFVGKMNLIK